MATLTHTKQGKKTKTQQKSTSQKRGVVAKRGNTSSSTSKKPSILRNANTRCEK